VYGVLARYHNHFSNKASYNADSVIHYANLAMLDNADNAMVKFQATNLSATNNFYGPLRNNLNSTTVVNPTAIRQATFIANLENGTNAEFAGVQDPRAWYLLRGNTNGTIKGVTPNLGQAVVAAADRPENFWGSSQAGVALNTAPNPENGRYVFRNAAPVPVLTASEMHFLKAEAAFRKGDKTTALAAYKEGINQSFNLLTSTYQANVPPAKLITEPTKAAYLNNTTIVPATPAGLNLSKIMLQKYISMFVHGALETWLDMRRFHYTDVDPATGNQVYRDFALPTDLFQDNGGLPVQRMRPRFNSEYVWNILELERIGATQNDYHVKEMWITKP
ncbi:MAG: SusD/RagB family nutrient-binding outer membrane lipoprotein, partial [Pedobacter sp.]